jgi:hypothetical protein
MPTRAYLRLDPHVYDRKVLGIDAAGDPIEGFMPYKPDELVAFFGVLALADGQSPRGFFRGIATLRAMLRGDGLGKRYAKCVEALISRGDLVVRSGGWLYVDGWDEWQEGDITVHERMRRYRARRAQKGGSEGAEVTPPTVTGVTPRAVTSDTPPVTADRRARDARGRSAEAEALAEAEAVAASHRTPPVKMTDDERAEARASMQAILDNVKSHPAAVAAAEKALAKLNGAAHEDPAPEPSEVVDAPPPSADEATEQEAAHG